MFVGLDFLEKSLNKIMTEGIEEEGTIDEILHKLHRVVDEKIGVKDIANPQEDEDFITGNFILAHEQMEKIEGANQQGFHVFYLAVKVEDACQLKEVRGYMILKELYENGEIVYSDPPFDDDNFGNLELDSNRVFAVLISELDSDVLEEKIMNISEIERVQIESYREIHTTLMEKLNLGQEKKKEKPLEDKPNIVISTLAAEFVDECLYEISLLVNSIEDNIDKISVMDNHQGEINKLFKGFHAIKGLSDFIDFSPIKGICEKTEALINDIMKEGRVFGEQELDIINESKAIIKYGIENYNNREEIISLAQNHLFKLDMMDVNDNKEVEKPEEKMEVLKEIRKELDGSNATNPLEEPQKIEEKKIESVPQKSSTLDSGYIKIPINKANILSDLTGELLILQSQMEQLTKDDNSLGNSLSNLMKRMDRITKEIQNISMSLQRTSLKSLFQKISRIGRDTALELNKKVDILVEGEGTEIDRDVVDKLLDPLMHLIRNSIHHGIEDEQERFLAGKSPEGRIKVKAENRKNIVVFQVSDDGKGIDVERIRDKLIEKNLIDPATDYGKQELIDMIFLPGFSTVENINNISGRGVGMDAVRTQITKLGGKIDIDSQAGLGTTFTFKIPINSAAMNGTIVEIDSKRYVIPTLAIKQILLPKEDLFVKIKNKNQMIKYRDKIIPIISLAGIIEKNNSIEYEKQTIIVLEYEDKLKALPVKNIFSRREIVVKPLGEEFNNLNFLSGATILGDGNIALILDVENLFNSL